MKAFAQTTLLTVLLCAAVLCSADKPKSDSLKSPNGAMLRSLAVPGWGQWYNGKKFKAVLIAGGEIGLVVDAVVLNQLAARSKTADERYFYRDNRNLAFWWLAAVILYSMADAYVDAHLYRFDESPDLSSAPLLMYKKAPGFYPPPLSLSFSVNL